MANKIAISFVISVFFMLILSNKLIQMKPDGSVFALNFSEFWSNQPESG